MPDSLHLTTNHNRVAVLNIVGLDHHILGQMQRLREWSKTRRVQTFPPAFPAVTCVAQSTYLTGLEPEDTGIVGNGWYNRTQCEVQFWKQSNKLVHGTKVWETLRAMHGSTFTCAKVFWWYNMYSTADWSITPRPAYPVDGRKVFDIYTHPMDMKNEIKADLGEFPFTAFWGPMAGIASTAWIAKSAMWIEEKHSPSLNLVYLPHLDYDLQRYGPKDSNAITPAIKAMDEVAMQLIDFYESRGVHVLVLSEYGISEVNEDIALNRIFREKGWIAIKEELGRDTLDCGASKAFAIADHQVAHVYINDPSIKKDVLRLLTFTAGVDQVVEIDTATLPPHTQERCADIIVTAHPGKWFSYYFWQDDSKSPDYARCVDIHRKPGYDPAELLMDTTLPSPKMNIARFLLKKALGFRAMLEVIPLHGNQVRGSHGRANVPPHEQPLIISNSHLPDVHKASDVYHTIIQATLKK